MITQEYDSNTGPMIWFGRPLVRDWFGLCLFHKETNVDNAAHQKRDDNRFEMNCTPNKALLGANKISGKSLVGLVNGSPS